jgi:hypothetical protein
MNWAEELKRVFENRPDVAELEVTLTGAQLITALVEAAERGDPSYSYAQGFSSALRLGRTPEKSEDPEMSPETLKSVQRGIAQAERGEVHDLGDFTQYAEDPKSTRRLQYRFIMLPFVTAVEVASSMNLIEPADRELNDLDKRKVVFNRAKEKGLLRELEATIGRFE